VELVDKAVIPANVLVEEAVVGKLVANKEKLYAVA
jgi:hypothetical protein